MDKDYRPNLSLKNRVEPDGIYARRVYDRVLEWYKAAETKVRLLLTVNGVFVTVAFSGLLGKAQNFTHAGAETYAFAVLAVVSLLAAVLCAATSLWSWHNRNIRDLEKLISVEGITYPPEAFWYFGNLAGWATKDLRGAMREIAGADRSFEARATAYHAIQSSTVVLRKHRFVNAGWAFTALTLLFFTAMGCSLFIRNTL